MIQADAEEYKKATINEIDDNFINKHLVKDHKDEKARIFCCLFWQ